MAKKKKRTGLVCVVEAVPERHQTAIVWTWNGNGEQVGFVYDEDDTLRKDVPEKVQKYCEENRFGIAKHLESKDWFENAVIEEVNQDTFLEWFGGKPKEAGLFFDSWGKSDDFRRLLGVPDTFDDEPMRKYRKNSRNAGLKAGAAASGVFLAGILVFVAASYLIAGDNPVTVSAYTLATVLLSILGGLLLIAEGQNVARYFYRKFL